MEPLYIITQAPLMSLNREAIINAYREFSTQITMQCDNYNQRNSALVEIQTIIWRE